MSQNSEWILIGCPVFRRQWILPHWFEAIAQQSFPLDRVGFTFLVSKEDTESVDCIVAFAAAHPELKCCDIYVEPSLDHMQHYEDGPAKRRRWGIHRYHRMVEMRNQLLDRVVCLNPDRFFSLDSDILLTEPNMLQDLFELDKPAVAPLCFMVPPYVDGSARFPNFMSWAYGSGTVGYRPEDFQYGELAQKDIIMAAVMMSRDTYTRARYQYHRQGEDLGWSTECNRLGIELWSASHLYAAHVMYEEDLELYLRYGDPRCHLAHKLHS